VFVIVEKVFNVTVRAEAEERVNGLNIILENELHLVLSEPWI